MKLMFFELTVSPNLDLSFVNLEGSTESSSQWALAVDLDDDRPQAPVLVLVRTGTKRSRIVDEIHRALTYWRKQIEPRF